MKPKVAVLISGRGSNMAALIDAAQDPAFPAEIALVLSNKNDAQGLKTAKDAGIATAVIDHTGFPDRESFDAAITERLEAAAIDIVCLAGFMRILSTAFVTRWHNRLINVHPSLLPAFRGLNTHKRALEAGAPFAGCTVHFVTPELDDGPIIAQASVATEPGDTPDTLAARVLKQEHRIYPLALRIVAENLSA